MPGSCLSVCPSVCVSPRSLSRSRYTRTHALTRSIRKRERERGRCMHICNTQHIHTSDTHTHTLTFPLKCRHSPNCLADGQMSSYKSNDFVRSTHEPPGALRYENTATRQDTSRPKSSSTNQLHNTHTSSLRPSFSSSSRPYDDEMDEEDMLESVYNTLSSSSISRDYAQSISRGHSIYSSDDSWKAEGKLCSERSQSSTRHSYKHVSQPVGFSF